MPDRDWWQALWPDPRRVLEEVGFARGTLGLDLCSGDGYFTIPMAELTAETVVAIELDDALIDAARRAAERAGVTNIRWVHGNAMHLDQLVRDEIDSVLIDRVLIDRVLIANTIHGALDKTALAGAVAQVLDANGRFIVINWWPRPREETTVLGEPRGPRDALRFSPEQVATWLEPAGFILDTVRDVGPFHYGAVFRLDAE